MASDKELTKLYKVRNGYGVIQGNKVIKEGNVSLTDKEHALQSWKVEEVIKEKEETTEPHQLSNLLSDVPENTESNIDRSIKKSRFNRVMKTPKE